jgi:hypothetical protein
LILENARKYGMFPHLCGEAFAEAVRHGADPKMVVPDDYAIVHGGTSPLVPAGETFSGATGPLLEDAAAAVPHGQIRTTTAGAIRAAGGVVEWVPEVSRHGTVNQQHVNITEAGKSSLSALRSNPVPKTQRIDGDVR